MADWIGFSRLDEETAVRAMAANLTRDDGLETVMTVTQTRQLSEKDLEAAERTWRRFQNEQINPEDLPSTIEAENRYRCLLIARLSVEELDDDERTAIVAGIAVSKGKLEELGKLAGLHARAARLSDYGTVRPSNDLGPRFDAARYCDIVALIETLTAQKATKRGDRHIIQCPWHDDRHPSLVIFGPGRGWWCFTCGIGGSAVDFVVRHQRINPVEALHLIEQLCDTYPEAWQQAAKMPTSASVERAPRPLRTRVIRHA